MSSTSQAEVVRLSSKCSKCGFVKSDAEFGRRHGKSAAPASWCRCCTNQYKAERRAAYKVRERIDYPAYKTCSHCRSAKPASEFRKLRSDVSGLDPWCRDCRGRAIQEWRRDNQEKVREQTLRAYAPERHRRAALKAATPPRFNSEGQLCSRCRQRLPVTEFYTSSRDRTGYVSVCKACTKEKTTNFRLDNIEEERPRRMRYHRMKKYGVSRDTFYALLSSQGNRCGACRSPLNGEEDGCVDHDHATKAIRGILCKKCNSGIGMLGDNLEGVRKAVAYLESCEVAERG